MESASPVRKTKRNESKMRNKAKNAKKTNWRSSKNNTIEQRRAKIVRDRNERISTSNIRR
jgi:hypothetical protein